MFRGKKERSSPVRSFFFPIFLGFVLMLFAVFAFLFPFGLIRFLPASLFDSLVLELLLLFLGIFFVREAFSLSLVREKFVFSLIGLFLFFFALFPLFYHFGLFLYLPVYVDFTVSPVLLSFLLFFSGLYLVVDRFFSRYPKRYS